MKERREESTPYRTLCHGQVVALLAYTMNPIYLDNLLNELVEVFNIDPRKARKVITDLKETGVIKAKRNHYYWEDETIVLEKERYYEAMHLMIVEYPKYEVKLKKAYDRYHEDWQEHVEIYKSIFNETVSDLSLSKSECRTFAPYFMYAFTEHPEILRFLPTALLRSMIAERTLKLVNADSSDGMEQLFDQVLDNINSRQLPHTLLHLLQLGYVMETGHRHEGISMRGNSSYKLLIAMLEALETEDYVGAAKHFEDAQACKVNEWEEGAAPCLFPLLNLLYGIARYKTDGSNGIDHISEKINGANTHTILAVTTFVNSLTCVEDEQTISGISTLIDNAPQTGWINQKIGIMLASWQGIKPQTIAKKSDNKAYCDPANVKYYAHATNLTDKLLRSVKVMQQWERTLEVILKKESNDGRQQTVDDQARTARIGYFWTGSNHLEVRTQTRLKSGKWSAGKKVSIDAFSCMKDAFLDIIDVNIQDVLRRKRQFYDLSLSDALPLLKGSRKLYYGVSAPYINCVVEEGKPFITTQQIRNGITIGTNLPIEHLSNTIERDLLIDFQQDKPLTGKKVETEGVVTYYKVPVRLRQYIKALIKVGKFPTDAEPQLKLVFEKLKDQVEIHSEMIEGGSTLPRKEGNAHIIIQIHPTDDSYHVQAIVRPLEDGTQTVVPGRGDSNVYDQGKDLVRYQVMRDKNQEKLNAKALRDFMEAADIEETSPYVWTLSPRSLLELMEWIPEQGDDYATEWPEGERIRLKTPDTKEWKITLRERHGWFDVEGTLPIDEKTVLSIGQLFSLLDESGGRFIKLDDNQYLRLTDSLRRQLQRIESVANNVRGKMRISPLGAGLIADYLDGDVSVTHPKKVDELRKRIKNSDRLQVEIPSELNATLRDYQTDGVTWLNRLTSWGAGACLADDMGLGKTIQTITFLLQKKADGASMVVAPASVVHNWKKELDRFAPTLNVTVLNDLASDDRKKAISQAADGDIVLTSYGLLISEEETLVEKPWNVVCLDEAQTIKNASTKSSAVCMKLQAEKRLILTGTPVQNHLGELWNLFCFINPGLLGSYEQFNKKFIAPIELTHDKERQQQLRRIVQPFMLRRTKKEVVKELPDKQEITIPVEMSEEELAIYEHLRIEAKKRLEEDVKGSGAASVNALAMITKLRMAACSATLVNKQWDGISSKLSSFCDLADEICMAGNRVLVFSQFTSFLEMAKLQLESRGMKDYLYLDGSTPIKKRTQMVEQFQTGKSPIFLISLKAGGLGLNLTGANYVIHLDPWWNPAIEQQATDRAYRIGQQQQVTVYHLISEHTIEEKMVRLHQTKRDLADSLLEGADTSHKLSAQDLLNMLQNDARK